MPRVFDNIDQALLPALRDTLAVSTHADFCVGYFNLRGWRAIDDLIDGWKGEAGQRCRVLIGMQRPPREDVRALYQVVADDEVMDNARATGIKHSFAAHLREQITFGAPTAVDESGLQRLAKQLREGKCVFRRR